VAADARPRGRCRSRGCACPAAGARPHGVVAARAADVPSVQLLQDVGVDRASAVAGTRSALARRTRLAGAADRRGDGARQRPDRVGLHAPVAHLRARRPARLRATAVEQRERDRGWTRPIALGVPLRLVAGRWWARAAQCSRAQLHVRQPRRGTRDVDASDVVVRTRRRWRACGPNLRREHDDVLVELLGTRSHARPHPARDGRAQAHRRDGSAVRFGRSRRACSWAEGRRQPHRLRLTAAAPSPARGGPAGRRISPHPTIGWL
jgi:hypothetical protein